MEKNMQVSFQFEGMHSKDEFKAIECGYNSENFHKVCPIAKNANMPGLCINVGFYSSMHRLVSIKFADNAKMTLAPDAVIPRKMADVLYFVCKNCFYHVNEK